MTNEHGPKKSIKFSASELKRWLLGAATFASLVIGSGVAQTWIYYHQASGLAQAEMKDARELIILECSIPAAEPDCRREILEEARDDQRAEFDLYSQKTMALWTAIMGAMAIIGASLSALGVYLIWQTWGATREAADNSRKTLRSFIAKERAMLVPLELVETSYSEVDGTETVAFYVRIRNGGQAPGTVILHQWEFIEKPFWPKSLDEIHSSRRTILADAEGKTALLPGPEDQQIGAVLYLVGLIAYETLENERCETPYSYRLRRIDHPYGSFRYDKVPVEVHGMPHHT